MFEMFIMLENQLYKKIAKKRGRSRGRQNYLFRALRAISEDISQSEYFGFGFF